MNKKQIMRYFRSWLGCSVVILIIPITVSAATLNPLCSVTQVSSTSVSFFVPSSTTPIGVTTGAIGNTAPSYQNIGSTTVCLSISPPSVPQPCSPSTDTVIIPDSTPYYASAFDDSNTYCSYELTLTSTPPEAIGQLHLIPIPSPIPLLTPLGLLGTITGLLWIGRRRSKVALSRKI